MDIMWFTFLVCCFTIVLCWLHYKKVVNARKESVGILLTLLGLFLTVGTDYVSQFDDPSEIFNKIIYPKYELNFEEIRAKLEKTNPHYLFALDISGSMKGEDKPKLECTKEINSIIKRINHSGYSEVNGWDFGVKDGKIEFYRLLQVRLMNTIIELEKNKRRNNLNYSYSVVLFAGSPYHIQESSTNQVFKTIYDRKPVGNETDFIGLFEYLCERIKDLPVDTKDRYKPVDCYVVLFSDYLHDVKGENSKLILEKKLKSKLHEIHRKNVSLKFFYYDINYELKKKDIDKISKLKKEILPIDSILKNVFPNGAFEEDDALLCPIISPKPISFFHSNSLYEEELSTYIKFDCLKHKRDFYFSLGKNSDISIENFDDLKQEYYLIEGTDQFHLSSDPQPIVLDSNDIIEFKIKGYIPAPYKSPDIIIKDEEEKMQYVIPVTFYKKLPHTGYLMLALLFSFLLCVFIIKLWQWYKKRSTSQISTNTSANNQQTTINMMNIFFLFRDFYNNTHSERGSQIARRENDG